MKPLFILLVCSLCFVQAAEPDLKAVLQNGLMAEEADRDLVKAAGAYEALIQAGEGQQRLIATAIYRLAEVRRKQDKKEEAIGLYQRLLREFPAQDVLAKLASENLTTLGAKLPERSSAPLIAADDAESLEIARMEKLLAESPDVARAEVPLHVAARNGWKRLAEAMIARGFDVNQRLPNEKVQNPEANELFLTPLAMSARHGHKAVAELFLAKGADVNDGRAVRDELTFAEKYPLIEALQNDRVEIAALLLERGALVNVKFTVSRPMSGKSEVVIGTPLHLVVVKGSLPLLKLLLAHHADVNAVTEARPASYDTDDANWIGKTPLFYAWDIEILKALVAAGANVDARNQTGRTPLFFAQVHGGYDSVTPLIKLGASVNVRDKDGRTPLMTTLDNLAKAQVLLTHGADPKVADDAGNTLLHIAAASSLTRSVLGKATPDAEALTNWLMSLPLDAATKNKAGKAALELAQENREGAKELELALLARTTAPSAEVRLYLADKTVKLQALYAPLADDEPLPSLAEFLLLSRAHERRALHQKPAWPRPPVGGRSRSPEGVMVNIIHPSAGDAVVPAKELVTRVCLDDESSAPAFAPLRPGDFVEPRDMLDPLVAQLQQKLATLVTVSFEGVERQFRIGGAYPWHPGAPELPGELWDKMLEPLFAGMNDVDIKQVKIIRTVHGKRVERVIDLTSTAPAGWPRIVNGDRVELVKRAGGRSDQDSSAIVVSMPEMAFSYAVRISGTEAPSLVAGVAMLSLGGERRPPVADPRAMAFFARDVVWHEGIGPLGRDWSRVTLWRAGKDSPEIFDLAAAAAKLDPDAGSRRLREAEPQVQAGDRIELPPKKGHETESMSKEVFQYLQRIMRPY